MPPEGLLPRPGLQYCAAVIAAHGGAIQAESSWPQGNVVAISLPTTGAARATAGVAGEVPEPAGWRVAMSGGRAHR